MCASCARVNRCAWLQVFVPAVKSSDDRKEESQVAHAVSDAPLLQLVQIVNMLLFGW
jgi:hypothetical protein